MTLSSLVSNEHAARNAKNYARSFILEGSTQLINNSYDIDKKKSLYKAIIDLRKHFQIHPISWLEFDKAIFNFYHVIERSKKFSIGNCYEMALLALDYVAHQTPSVNAEVYQILGGDHVVLVVGRKKESDRGKPETWGDETYICDPWSDSAYPASEYLSKTKNFYRSYRDNETGNYTNNIQDFNPAFHTLSPRVPENTDYIRKYNSIAHLAKIHHLFQKKQGIIISATENVERALAKIRDGLNQYGSNKEKYHIINNKIINLQGLLAQLKTDFNQLLDPVKNYNEIRSNLDRKLRNSIKAYSKATLITRIESRKLAKRVGIWENFCYRFFNISPAVVTHINKALKESQEQLKTVMKEATLPALD
jgi:hypothetical protein